MSFPSPGSGNLTVAAETGKPVSLPHAFPECAKRIRSAMHSNARCKSACGPRLGSRDQVRRLPAPGAPQRRDGAPVHPARLRLDRPLSCDRRRGSSGPAPSRSTARPASAVRMASPIFDALHRRGTVSEAMLYGFDLLEVDGEDLRALPLGDRKKRLARLLARRRVGIVLSQHTAADGATIFQQACRMGLEGIVSKRITAPYRSGPSRDWIKVKNPDSPAMIQAREMEW